jgi:uncharacterized protein (TIGR03435 family)
MAESCGQSGRKLWVRAVGMTVVFALVMLLSMAGRPARAQAAASPVADAQSSIGSQAVPFAFDVASIKPSDPNARGLEGGFSASGLRAIDYPLSGIVYMAYFPLNSQKNGLIGMPDWASKERYDVVAHIDEATAAAWLKLAPLQRQQPGRVMLQQLLAERCKLVAHTVPSQVDGYVLVVSKGGSRLTPTKPDETYPADAKNSGDGAKVVAAAAADNTHTQSYFNTTLARLAEFLSWGWPIEEQTNLTGRYDFTVRRLNPVDAEGKRIADPQPSDMWDLSGTGLEIKPTKIASENLVIDHRAANAELTIVVDSPARLHTRSTMTVYSSGDRFESWGEDRLTQGQILTAAQ